MSTILMADTPHSAALLIPAISETNANDGPVISIIGDRLVERGHCFRFPGLMSYDVFPIVQPVEYESFISEGGFAPRRKTTPISHQEAMEALKQAETVYFFGKANGHPTRLFHAERTVKALNPSADMRVIEDHLFSPNESKFAVATAAPVIDYQLLLDSAAILEYFDFNYRINSFALMSRLYPRHGLRWRFGLSAAGLQLLLWWRLLDRSSHNFAFDRDDVSRRIALWSGTGAFTALDRYGKRIGLGSQIAMDAPLQDLEMCRILDKGLGNSFKLSDAGRALADEFPPGCHDPDQPFRIEAWTRLAVEKAHAEIDHYLLSFFKDHRSMAQAGEGAQVELTWGAGV
jgi:hypothetical protein